MHRRGRSLFLVALAALATAMVGVSVAWACTGPDYGTPSSPAAPPPNSPPAPADPGGSTPGPSGPSSGAGVPAAPAPAPTVTGQGVKGTAPAQTGDRQSTSGSRRQATQPARRPARQPAGGRGGATQPANRGAGSGSGTSGTSVAAPNQQFAARESGATAGVTVQNGQSVFASSTAPKDKKAAGSDAGSRSPSERTAVSDAWSGFRSGTPLAAGPGTPAASSLSEHGFGSTLAMAILGLGFVGMLGTFLMLAAPRLRRVVADRQGTDRNERGPSGR